jgi:peptidoglycan hydrolase-like protein with peptidoglycan-binding domain
LVDVSKFSKMIRVGCSMLLLASLAYATTATTKTPAKSSTVTSKKTSHKTPTKSKKSRKTASRKRGQQNIDPTRAREIQEALIRDGYMQGEASGTWDQTSQKAMEKFQSDNGWQSKVIPDSRALIKLGLGPDHQHLLNPESAMTTTPAQGPSALKDSAGERAPQK